MDSGNKAVENSETDQPALGVPNEAEETARAQSGNIEDGSIVIGGDGDHQKPPEMSREQAYAAWKREKTKRRDKQKQLDSIQQENENLQNRIKDLEAKVGSFAKGPRPDPYDFESTDKFYEALEQWANPHTHTTQYGTSESDTTPAPVQAPAKKAAGHLLTDEEEYHLFTSEQEIKKFFSGYDQAKDNANYTLKRLFGANTDVASELAKRAYIFGVDPAKVFVAIDKIPEKAAELLSISHDEAKIGRWLKDTEKRVKLAEHKKLDTEPEPHINNSGPVDMLAAKVKKAQEVYTANPTLANHKKLMQARSNLRKQHNG